MPYNLKAHARITSVKLCCTDGCDVLPCGDCCYQYDAHVTAAHEITQHHTVVGHHDRCVGSAIVVVSYMLNC